MWTVPPRASDDARDFAQSLGTTLTAAAVLRSRGYGDAASATRYLTPRLSDLTPPHAMADRPQAASRIARAVRSHERICVFGDYDADGVTSTALMTDVLRALGGEVVPLLADRFAGGYGFSEPALQRVLSTSATLLITCDCGTSDHERLAGARARGVDVIVIDHHRVPDEPLPALAFLNPHRPECAFPYKGLASVGLALSICAGVRAELGVSIDLRQWLDLVALGTIADVAPLDGDNRLLVRGGLALLARGARCGVRALAEVANHVGGFPLTGEDVAFRLAPRINAPGRLSKPDLALELLLAKTEGEARLLAAQLDQACEQRKLLDRAILAEALVMLEDPALAALPVVVLGHEGWHQGVVGIVAGRLASRLGKPTIIVGFDGDTGRGSVRGPGGVPLYSALKRCSDVLIGFGGHEAAAGVHVSRPQFERLRERFAEACTQLTPAVRPSRDAAADAVLEEADDPAAVLADFGRFEPCGESNPAPVVAMDHARVRAVRQVKGHLSVEVQVGGRTMRCFGFEMAAQAPLPNAIVRVMGKLRHDTYRGGGAVEMRIESIEPA